MTDPETSEERGSRAEALLAEEHHLHHPADPNVGVVRVPVSRTTILAGSLATAVTVALLVLLGLAIGGR